MAFSFKDIFKSLGAGGTTPTKVVGIDIGSAAVKVVELEKTASAVTLKTYGELQLGPYDEQPLGQAVSLSQEKKTEALVDVIREANVQSGSGVLAMSLASSFVTVVPVSMGAGETLDSKIPIEAKKYIPIPLSDVMLDWVEIPIDVTKTESTKEILLVAVQTEAMNMYTSLMSTINMVSQPSEIEVFSTIRALYDRSAPTTVIIDLGARVSKLYVVHNGQLERIHRVSVGGARVTKRLSELLDIPLDEAENVKRNYVPDSDVRAADIKKSFTTTMLPVAQEFKRIIDQYERRTERSIDQVVCTGGAAGFADTEVFMQDQLGRPVALATPFSRVAYPAFMEDTLKKIGPTFSVSLGAALRVFE